MKMITMTRKTSVSGVMLISAKIESPPSSSSPLPASGSFPIAIAVSLGASSAWCPVASSSSASCRLLRARRLRVAAAVEQELEELVGEELHLRRDRGSRAG